MVPHRRAPYRRHALGVRPELGRPGRRRRRGSALSRAGRYVRALAGGLGGSRPHRRADAGRRGLRVGPWRVGPARRRFGCCPSGADRPPDHRPIHGRERGDGVHRRAPHRRDALDVGQQLGRRGRRPRLDRASPRALPGRDLHELVGGVGGQQAHPGPAPGRDALDVGRQRNLNRPGAGANRHRDDMVRDLRGRQSRGRAPRRRNAVGLGKRPAGTARARRDRDVRAGPGVPPHDGAMDRRRCGPVPHRGNPERRDRLGVGERGRRQSRRGGDRLLRGRPDGGRVPPRVHRRCGTLALGGGGHGWFPVGLGLRVLRPARGRRVGVGRAAARPGACRRLRDHRRGLRRVRGQGRRHPVELGLRCEGIVRRRRRARPARDRERLDGGGGRRPTHDRHPRRGNAVGVRSRLGRPARPGPGVLGGAGAPRHHGDVRPGLRWLGAHRRAARRRHGVVLRVGRLRPAREGPGPVHGGILLRARPRADDRGLDRGDGGWLAHPRHPERRDALGVGPRLRRPARRRQLGHHPALPGPGGDGERLGERLCRPLALARDQDRRLALGLGLQRVRAGGRRIRGSLAERTRAHRRRDGLDRGLRGRLPLARPPRRRALRLGRQLLRTARRRHDRIAGLPGADRDGDDLDARRGVGVEQLRPARRHAPRLGWQHLRGARDRHDRPLPQSRVPAQVRERHPPSRGCSTRQRWTAPSRSPRSSARWRRTAASSRPSASRWAA